MASHNGDHEHELSAFRGRPLERIAGLEPHLLKGLHTLGIYDAEQLVAIASIDGKLNELATHLNTTIQEVRHLVDV
jgi:hypothetical protein